MSSVPSFFRYHVFFCTNQRAQGETCCQNHRAKDMQLYMKQRIKSLGLNGEGQVRVNSAGCMGRCDAGPVVVVYPDAVWYTFVDQEDIDEIITTHLQQGQIVQRLRLEVQP
ncbi:2Fe-2S ferredoxin [Thioflexithrix psekupsensis]|uniref:NADH-quinone oxidoreductase subunit F n=2 Tax=Thioflexithrix psekupsensis TaxID=1570016 RepID=A0A251X4G7_9GAMM|nr:2Fe-2S ferredoxin [Thioflexithrix psekupsensis]